MKYFLITVMITTFGIVSPANAGTDNIDGRNLNKTKVHCKENMDKANELKNSPGRYYYLIGICKYEHIMNEKEFLEVTGLLNKSASYNYPLSYFALGYMYESKYTIGSKVYGVKGKPEDIIIAIDNYKKAAEIGSSYAQNNLGEIYLNEANLNDDERTKDVSLDVVNSDAPISLPDIDNAIIWFQKAARNGNPAAQGTLGDLYKQGIGVPQDYVMSYVWDSLSYTSQMRFNNAIQNEIGRKVISVVSKERDDTYLMLTNDQKNEARKLVKEYSSKYIVTPTVLTKDTGNTQSFLAARNMLILLDRMKNAYYKYHSSVLEKLIKLCGATYQLNADRLTINIDMNKVIDLLPEAMKETDIIYNSKLTENDLLNATPELTMVASLKAATFIMPVIFEGHSEVNNLKVIVYISFKGSNRVRKKYIWFSYTINREQYNKIDWDRFDITKSQSILDNFEYLQLTNR